MALITVDKPAGGKAWMRIDGSAATAILDPKTAPPLHPDEMAYVLHRDRGPVLVIGAGGGREIRAALKNGQRDIHGVELNPIIALDVMQGRYKAFSGDLYDKPEVHVTVADGRSYLRRSGLRFRNIVISLVDTLAAASVGALALTEDNLYTVEAFHDYIDHLDASGTLIVNRWDTEFDRLLGLGAAGLRAAGAVDPQKHLFACSAERSTSLLLKRSPLTQQEIVELRGHCRRNKFEEAFAPDQPHSEARRRIASMGDIQRALPDSPTDLTPPTDDRPFFFYGVPLRRLGQVVFDWRGLTAGHQGLLTLLGLLVVSVGFALIFVLGPLAFQRWRASSSPRGWGQPAPRWRALLFFWCLGAGFVSVEVALVQHFGRFLGRPVYALSTVLVALLLFAGLGSLQTARVKASLATLSAGRRAQLLVALLSISAMLLGPTLGRLVSLPFAARLAVTLVFLAPLGLLMGSQAPLGVKILSVTSPELIPWCWGLNSVAGAVAAAFGMLLALHLGFSAVLLVGGASYLVAAIAVPAAPAEDQED